MSPDPARTRGGPIAAATLIALCVLVDGCLFAVLLGAPGAQHPLTWWMAHALVAGVAAAVLVGRLMPRLMPTDAVSRRRWFALCFCLNVAMPLVGIVGTSLALTLGIGAAAHRHRHEPYWQFTPDPALPYTTPVGRRIRVPDSRGLAEQLAFSHDTSGLYRKLLAAGRMPSALSVDALRDGVGHADERLRLTAYQTLDRKSTQLNDEIDRLGELAEGRTGRERSDTWLQVAGNYWELLTLEQDEPVARTQLLERAGAAALQAIIAWPESRNAHFTFGRVSLRQGDARRADIAFERSQALGMPASTVLPYRAESAFVQRDLPRVRRTLADIDTAFKAYPPLRQVVEHWT